MLFGAFFFACRRGNPLFWALVLACANVLSYKMPHSFFHTGFFLTRPEKRRSQQDVGGTGTGNPVRQQQHSDPGADSAKQRQTPVKKVRADPAVVLPPTQQSCLPRPAAGSLKTHQRRASAKSRAAALFSRADLHSVKSPSI